jgi:hypothetical protein
MAILLSTISSACLFASAPTTFHTVGVDDFSSVKKFFLLLGKFVPTVSEQFWPLFFLKMKQHHGHMQSGVVVVLLHLLRFR